MNALAWRKYYQQKYKPSEQLPHQGEVPTYPVDRPYKYTRRRMLHLASAMVAAPSILTLLPAIARGEPIQAWRFGATGNASQDATTALQNAINAVGTTTLDGYIQLRRGIYQTTSALTVAANKAVNIVGEFNQYDNGSTGTLGQGTWLFLNHAGKGILASSTNGLVLKDFGTYRTQPAASGGWAPGSFDWDIYCAGGDFQGDNLMLYNATKGMALDGVGRIDWNRIRGQAFTNFLYIDMALDTPRVRNCHNYTFYSSNSNIVSYQLNHTIGYEVRRADNMMMTDCFSIAAQFGLKFNHGSGAITGDASKFRSTGCDFDGCANAVYWDAATANCVSWFTNTTVSGSGTGAGGGSGFTVKGGANTPYLTNFQISDFHGNGVDNSGTSCIVHASQVFGSNWDKDGAGFTFFNSGAGCTTYMIGVPLLVPGGSTLGGTSGGAGTYSSTP